MVTSQPKISLSLDAADTTIMHRVGMSGLYMTLKRLEKQYPLSRQRGGHISWFLTADTIELFWEGSDFLALSWLINESFKLDDTGLIHLAGLNNDAIDLSQKIYIHEGICAVFLRLNKFYQWQKLVIEDSKGYLFNQLFSNREGFIIMAENSEEDKQYLIFIKVFQQAMKGNFAKMYAKAEEGKDPPIKKRVDRLRAELNYCYDDLSFQEYLSDFLVRGGLNKYFNEHQEQISLLIKKTPWQELRMRIR